MSVLFRARVSSFLAGLGVATMACMYQLKHDIDQSYTLVLDAVRLTNSLCDIIVVHDNISLSLTCRR